MPEPKLGDVLSGVDPIAFISFIAPERVKYIATAIFLVALLHTFATRQFQTLARRYPEGSIAENFFHLLGEVEVVFGFWSAVFLSYVVVALGGHVAISYLEHLNFTEPGFVFVIMAMAATRPVLYLASQGIRAIAKLLPMPKKMAFLFSALVIGPLLGSFITEPAAMTVTALLLRDTLFTSSLSNRTKYVVLGTLFVNVSIGGVLTPYAAPPVLMVASQWGWDLPFMLQNFGWKAVLAVVCNATLAVSLCRKDLKSGPLQSANAFAKTPLWLSVVHLFFLFLVVKTSHHLVVFAGVFLFFLGIVAVTEEHQDELKIRESLLVAFFLAGLVVLGSVQKWWLEPILLRLTDYTLFFGATALTAITDNAALTYLGAQVGELSSSMKYYLVAGAVAGGGLTVIANAPNPAGYSILQKSFGEDGISPGALFIAALAPTLIALVFFGFLP